MPSERLWWVWGLVLNVISSLLPSCWGFSFADGCGVSFFGAIQQSPVNGYSAASCNFGVLAREDEPVSFYSAVLIELRWTGHGGDVLTKCGPVEKAMENHFSILALRTP